MATLATTFTAWSMLAWITTRSQAGRWCKMTHKSGNYSFKEPPFKDGDTVTGGNYMQIAPATVICAGVKNLTITGGNFVNCVKQPTWDVKGGNWCQVSRCSHKHPEWLVDASKPCPLCGSVVELVEHPDGLDEVACSNPNSVVDRGGLKERIIIGVSCLYRKKAVMVRCPEDCQHRSATKELVELSYEDVVQREETGVSMSEYKAEIIKDKYNRDVLRRTVNEHVYRDKVQK